MAALIAAFFSWIPERPAGCTVDSALLDVITHYHDSQQRRLQWQATHPVSIDGSRGLFLPSPQAGRFPGRSRILLQGLTESMVSHDEQAGQNQAAHSRNINYSSSGRQGKTLAQLEPVSTVALAVEYGLVEKGIQR